MASEENKNSEIKTDSAASENKKQKKGEKKEIDGVVVVTEKKGPSAKPIIMGIVLVILIAATVATVTFFIRHTPELPSTEATVTTAAAILQNSATTNYFAPQTETSTKREIILDGDAKAFAQGTYSLDGTIYVAGQNGGDAVNISRSPDVSNISGLCSGMWLSVLNEKGQKYLIDTESKTYIDFTVEAYEKLGVDKIPYDVELPGDLSGCEFKRADVLLNGDNAICYGADCSLGSVEIYTVDGVLKQFVVFDKNSAPMYEVIVNSFSSVAARDQLTTNGLAKSTSVFSFFSAIS